MTHRRMTRALVALALPALLVPITAPPASAAPKAPAVPTIGAVAKVYPHLTGGSAETSRVPKLRMPTKACGEGTVIKGATGREAVYGPKVDSRDDLEFTGKKPIVGVTAATFPSAKIASRYLRATLTAGEDCPAEAESTDDVRLKKIKFKLGAERWGFEARMGTKKAPQIMNFLVIRSGKVVLNVMSMSLAGSTAPSVAKTVALARLALKTAR